MKWTTLFVEGNPSAGEPIRAVARSHPAVEVEVVDTLSRLQERLDACPDINDFVVDLLLSGPDPVPPTLAGFEAVRLIRGKRPNPVISLHAPSLTLEQRRQAADLHVSGLFEGTGPAVYSAIIATHQRIRDWAVLSAPFSPAEQDLDATYDWCLTDEGVQERYGGLVVVASNKEVLGAGRTHTLAWEDAQQKHQGRCPPRAKVVFVAVPGLASLGGRMKQGSPS
jgi:hypothetical protein